jgi:Xaa-Pro aminopeptidase
MLERSVFARRRAEYMRLIGPRAVAVLHSPPEARRNGDVTYRFRQSSDLYYLTGFAEPEATVVLRPGAATEQFVMFVRPRDRDREIWDGRRAGVEGAVAEYGADAAYNIAELERRLTELCANAEDLYYGLGFDPDFDRVVSKTIAGLRLTDRRGQRPPRRVIDPRGVLHEMRLRKSPDEAALLRRAAAISAEAHSAAMRAAGPGAAAATGPATGRSSAPARTRRRSTTSRTAARSRRATWSSSTPAASTTTTQPTSRGPSRPAGPSPRRSAAATSSSWRPRRTASA